MLLPVTLSVCLKEMIMSKKNDELPIQSQFFYAVYPT